MDLMQGWIFLNWSHPWPMITVEYTDREPGNLENSGELELENRL